MSERPGKSKDRRTQRTQRLLHQALGSLIQEKPYGSIVVKEILERANVGRSTFYTHFRDKDDLLVDGIHVLLDPAHRTPLTPSPAASDRLIWFSLPLFEHIDRHRHTSRIGSDASAWSLVHGHLQSVLTELIADDLESERGLRRSTRRPIPTDLLAHYVASAFVFTLTWWVESRSPLSPAEINEHFRSLIIPSLATVMD